jgi:oxygen-dependent protoporphyrinogen oxidase
MRAMIGGGEDPGAIELSDADMLAVVRADLARTMRVEVAPAFTRIFRHRLGIPQYTLGHLATLDAIAGRLERHPGLLLAGNSYKGVSLNACIAEAGIVARALLQAVA